MRAVWSFWTKPYLADRKSSWYSEFHHWLGWGLSVGVASRHYEDTQLVTDDAGARILIDELKLPFAHVSTALNAFADEDPGWWALGKLEAYRIQDVPFVHIDTDVFLWLPLRPGIESADVFAQNPEPFTLDASYYIPGNLEQALAPYERTWLPEEWHWYRAAEKWHARAECCGVFGGNRLDFIEHYATTALRTVRGENRGALEKFLDKSSNMILVEQYLLTACLERHAASSDSPYSGVRIRYVFNSVADAYNKRRAAEAGYTHLAAGTKRDPALARDLEMRVASDFPEHFARCVVMCGERAKPASFWD